MDLALQGSDWLSVVAGVGALALALMRGEVFLGLLGALVIKQARDIARAREFIENLPE